MNRPFCKNNRSNKLKNEANYKILYRVTYVFGHFK